MKKRLILLMILALAGLASAMISYAAVPAPPVNQHLGIADSTFNNLTTAQCRFCHNQNPPPGLPIDPTYLPTRHHLLVAPEGQTPFIIPDGTAAPCADAGHPYADIACTPGTSTYVCESCHKNNYDPITDTFTLDTTFKDNCALCHEQIGTGLTVHHAADIAQDGLCHLCHGDFVASVGLKGTNEPGAPQPAPTYQPSIVTPWPSKKLNGDNTVPANSAGAYAGNCDFCHNTRNGIDQTSDNTGPFAPVNVYINEETHHRTGFFEDDTKCVWCHNGSGPPTADGQSIRTCQNCHDIRSLHNIQYDNAQDGILPGNELPGYGHIGEQDDCWGCHGNNGQTIGGAATGSPTSATVPGAYSTSFLTAKAGANNPLTLTGTGFINSVNINGTLYNFEAKVLLTDMFGATTELTGAVTPTTVNVTLPPTLLPGVYTVQAKKSSVKRSNPLVVVLKPTISISSATCSSGNVTIDGSNFGVFMNAKNSGTSVTGTVNGISATGKVSSWIDSQINAGFASCPSSITVKNVFGSADFTMAPPPPPSDTTAPTVTAFSLPSKSRSLTVKIRTFTATDNVGVTGYLVTESSTKPVAYAAGWSSTKPTSYTFTSKGTKRLYAWAKDAAGNVSNSRNARVRIR